MSQDKQHAENLGSSVGYAVESQWEREEIAEYPFEVFHPDAEIAPPKFRSWSEAIAAQAAWNRDVPGHKARRRKLHA